MEIQTRSEVNGLRYHQTVEDAMRAALMDGTIWKVSFNTSTGERVRLIRTIEGWTYENIMGERLIRE